MSKLKSGANVVELENVKTAIAQSENKLSTLLYQLLLGNEVDLKKIENTLEWFITWRIKLIDLNNTMWCDGVSNLDITIDNNSEVSIYASIRIGPENDVSKIYTGILQGWFRLKDGQKVIKHYDIAASVNEKTYAMSDKT